MKLHKIKVFAEDPELPTAPQNIKITVDGKEIQGVYSFEYRVSVDGFPQIKLGLVADVDIETDARVEKQLQSQSEADATF